MSKAVMLSIRPKWCEKICGGEKTIEVRKTCPKLETPFRCYIYCTKDEKMQWWKSSQYSYADDHSHNAFDKCGNGKVIGEFICDAITPLFNVCTDNWHHLAGDVHEWHKELVKRAFLTDVELKSYAKGKNCFAWHISDLKIYDKPKELSKFERPYECNECDAKWATECNACHEEVKIKRPPQSWCYVEEI